MLHISTLLYGGPGVGKTALATSSFWDYKKREPIEGRNGRLLLIGREENDALGIPDEFIVRFPLPQNDPIAFVNGREPLLVSCSYCIQRLYRLTSSERLVLQNCAKVQQQREVMP